MDEEEYEEVPERAESEVLDDESRSECDLEEDKEDNEITVVDGVEDEEEDTEDENVVMKDKAVEEQMERRHGPRRREGLRPRKPPTKTTDGYN